MGNSKYCAPLAEISQAKFDPERQVVTGWARSSGADDGITTFHRFNSLRRRFNCSDSSCSYIPLRMVRRGAPIRWWAGRKIFLSSDPYCDPYAETSGWKQWTGLLQRATPSGQNSAKRTQKHRFYFHPNLHTQEVTDSSSVVSTTFPLKIIIF